MTKQMMHTNMIPSEDDIPDWSNPWIYSDVNIIRNLNRDNMPQLPLKRAGEDGDSMQKRAQEEVMVKRGLWNMFRMFEDEQEQKMMKRNFVPMLG